MGLTVTVSCRAPAPPSPEPLPTLSRQFFEARAPSSLCTLNKVESCGLDHVGGVAAADVMIVKRHQDVALVGWAADAESGTIPSVVLIELVSGDKKFYALASRNAKHPGAGDALKLPLADAGYAMLAAFKDVVGGTYAVNVLQVNVAGKGLTCDTKRKLKVE